MKRNPSLSPSALEVWLDADFVGELQLVGNLSHDRGQVRFRYHDDWLQQRIASHSNWTRTLRWTKRHFFPDRKQEISARSWIPHRIAGARC